MKEYLLFIERDKKTDDDIYQLHVSNGRAQPVIFSNPSLEMLAAEVKQRMNYSPTEPHIITTVPATRVLNTKKILAASDTNLLYLEGLLDTPTL